MTTPDHDLLISHIATDEELHRLLIEHIRVADRDHDLLVGVLVQVKALADAVASHERLEGRVRALELNGAGDDRAEMLESARRSRALAWAIAAVAAASALLPVVLDRVI
jgi:hypothetical protein